MKDLKDPDGDGEFQLRVANKRKILEDEIESRLLKVRVKVGPIIVVTVLFTPHLTPNAITLTLTRIHNP